MRNLFIAALCVLGSFSSIQAQVFTTGLQGGFTATQVDGDAISGFNKLGFHGAAFVRAELTDQITAKMEIGYVGKGSRKPGDPDNPAADTWGYTFHYIEIPVLAEYQYGQFKIQAGPYAGLLVSGNQMFNQINFEVINPPLNDLELGFMAGTEYAISDKVYGLVRYSQSLSAVRSAPDPGGVTTFYDRRMINIVLQFGVGIQFGD